MGDMRRTPKVQANDLVSFSDIAKRLGLKSGSIRTWYYNKPELGFPKPVYEGSTNLWDWNAVEKWVEGYRPELLLSPEDKERLEEERKLEKRKIRRMNRLNSMLTPLGMFKNIDAEEIAAAWPTQDKPLEEFLSLELLRRGYRWGEGEGGKRWNEKEFRRIMNKVLRLIRANSMPPEPDEERIRQYVEMVEPPDDDPIEVKDVL